MKLTAAELACVRSQGLYITRKCDGCGKLLNQTVQYTITGRREVYCSGPCRDNDFLGDRHEAKKRSTPGKCAYCGGSLKGKKRGALYCDDTCRMRHCRAQERTETQRVEKSRTPTQSNQGVVGANNADEGNRITSTPQCSRNARGGVGAKLGSSVEVGQATSGSNLVTI
jgi:hypothetical protein